MKKAILLSLLILLTLFVLGFLIIDYRSVNNIPEDILSRADTIWETYMIKGMGVYYDNGKEYPPISEEDDSYMENPKEASWTKSGIIIKLPLDNGYARFEGGAIDVVKGPTYDYELYGRIVGQYHIPHKLAWNDEYHYSHSDYYLLKRNNNTGLATIVKKWTGSTAQYGSLQYDHNTNILHIKLCGAGDESINVDTELFEDNKPTTVQCTK